MDVGTSKDATKKTVACSPSILSNSQSDGANSEGDFQVLQGNKILMNLSNLDGSGSKVWAGYSLS